MSDDLRSCVSLYLSRMDDMMDRPLNAVQRTPEWKQTVGYLGDLYHQFGMKEVRAEVRRQRT